VKRRGFTLIELMVVIAIIIILAAIAIPNYLKMTERAKKSRVASDMATLATGLETFRTDWGSYPVGVLLPVDTAGNVVYGELTGTAGAAVNVAGHTNAIGEEGPQEYLKAGTLTSIIDPFENSAIVVASPSPAGDGHIYYTGNINHWVLSCYAPTTTGGVTVNFMWRTDSSSTIATGAAVAAVQAP